MDEIIFIVILILALAFLAVITIIVVIAYRTIKTLDENKRFLLEQKDEVQLMALVNLESSKTYYNKSYTYIGIFQTINKNERLELYIEAFDARDLILDEEYLIIHDGVVLFEFHKKIN